MPATESLVKMLQDAKTFFLATVENGEPRVRPFGLALWIDGKAYFGTGSAKPCHAQMRANPAVELCAMLPDGRWVRARGRAAFDDRRDVKEAMFAAMPSLKGLYPKGADEPGFAVFHLADADATVYGFGPAGMTAEPVK